MKLTLTRFLTSPDGTIGSLRCENENVKIATRECKMPKSAGAYIGKLLPPGRYQLNLITQLQYINDIPVRIWWFAFDNIPWFPQSCFSPQNRKMRSGAIGIGFCTDNYNLFDLEDATVILTRWAKKAHDSGEEVFLEIIESEDMEIIEETEDQKKQRLEDEEKERRVKETLKWLYGEERTNQSDN